MDYGLLIPFFTFVAVFCLGGAALLVSLERRETVRARLSGAHEQSVRPAAHDENPRLLRAMTTIGSAVSAGKASSKLRKQMMRAGFHGRNAVMVFMGSKMYLLFLGLVLIGGLMALFDLTIMLKVVATVGGAGFLFFIPNIYVQVRGQNRSTEVRMHLPDVVDLLEICVSGGMGLDTAWNSVADEIRAVSPLLADEMALTNLEMHLGEERGAAIRHMAERTGADELSSLVAVLVQSQRFGTSVSDALRVFATSMRELRSQRAEEMAEKMSVKMLFPMIVLIFPVVIIVAVGPAALTLIEVLGQ